MKNRANEAVSDIVGTVLLLGMTIALFSVLCVGVLSYPSSPSEPAVNLVGTIIETPDDGVYLKVIITLDGGQSEDIRVGGYLTDENKDNKWNIGEGFYYQLNDYVEGQVKFTVVDTESNTVILLGSLQGT